MNAHFIIGLGSNLGSRYAYLCAAVDLLRDTPGITVCKCSSVYETDAIGPPQPRYLNAAVLVQAAHSPEQLLATALRIESLLGRQRIVRWAARTVDLDILWAEQGAIHTSDLTVPHPRLTERNFALAPLIEVAPQLAPEYGPTLRRLGVPHFVRPLGDEPLEDRPDGIHQKIRFVQANGLDRADYLASAALDFALIVTERRVPAAQLELHTIHTTCTAGDEAIALIEAVVNQLNIGFVISRVVVTSLEPGNVHGRLLGRAGPAIDFAFPELKVVENVGEGRARIFWHSL